MSHVLSATDIFGADDLESTKETVPEWRGPDGEPGTIILRQLSAEESISMNEEIEKAPKDGMFIILVRCAVDENGAQLFTSESIPALRKKSMRVLNRLQRAALRVNSMTTATEVALKKD